MRCWNFSIASSKLESIHISGSLSRTIWKLSITICYTVSDCNYSNWTCCWLSVKIPSIIWITVWDTSIKYIAFTTCKLSCKSICIFTISTLINWVNIIKWCTVDNQVVAWPCIFSRLCICIFSCNLKTCISVSLKYTFFKNVIVSRKKNTIISCMIEVYSFKIPVISIMNKSSVKWS